MDYTRTRPSWKIIYYLKFLRVECPFLAMLGSLIFLRNDIFFWSKIWICRNKRKNNCDKYIIYLGRATIYVLHDLRCLPPLSTTQESTTTTGTRWRTAGRGNVSNSDSISGIISFAIKFCEQGRDLSTDYLLLTRQRWFVSSVHVYPRCVWGVLDQFYKATLYKWSF